MGEWDNSRMHDPAYMAERIASCEAEIAKDCGSLESEVMYGCLWQSECCGVNLCEMKS